jgi:hypothetical protein
MRIDDKTWPKIASAVTATIALIAVIATLRSNVGQSAYQMFVLRTVFALIAAGITGVVAGLILTGLNRTVRAALTACLGLGAFAASYFLLSPTM